MPPGEEAAFLAPLPIRRLWGAGEVTACELAKLGETYGDLAAVSADELRARFGAHGEGLWRAADGIDDSSVTPEHEDKFLSREETFAQDVSDPVVLRRELLRQSESVALSPAATRPGGTHDRAEAALRRLHDPDPADDTGRAHRQRPGDLRQVFALFEAAWERRRAVRLVGVGTSNLEQPTRQLQLFEQEDRRQAQLDAAVDRICGRYGHSAIQRASLMEEPEELWVPKSVPDK